MTEALTVDRWLYAKLTADATLMSKVTAVHSYPIPDNATLPYVLMQEQSVSDIRGVGPYRIGVSGLWLVRVVARAVGWGGNLEAAADRIDAVLQAASGSVTGGVVWACVRERPFRLVETTQSGQFRHCGGVYRIWASDT